MGTVGVSTEQLPLAAARIAVVGRQLGSVLSAMGRVEAAGFAADAPDVGVALSALAQAWAGAASSVVVSTDALAATTSASGAAYDATDSNAFGAIAGGRLGSGP